MSRRQNNNRTQVMQYVVLLVVFVMSACGGKKGSVKSLSDLEAATKVGIQTTTGDKQSVYPRKTLAEPITFTIRDEQDKAVPDANVEYRLIDVTGLEDVTTELLLTAWQESKLSIASDYSEADDEMLEEDLVGRIVDSDSSTNGDGQASATIQAPQRFSRTIAVVARVVGEDLGGGSGFATFTTEAFGAAESLVFETTNALEEIAGIPFEIYLSIHNENGPVKNFDTKTKFNFDVSIPESHTASVFPEGEVECEFSGGRCKIPGGPYVLNTKGTVQIKIEELNVGLSPIESTINVEQGKPSDLLLSYNPPGEEVDPVCKAPKDKSADLDNPCITISADIDELKIYVLAVDQGGNPISGSPSDWTVDSGVLTGKLLSAKVADGSNAQTLSPELASKTSGLMTVSTPDGFTRSFAYQVLPGVPTSYTVSSENNNAEVATVPFKTNVEIYDRKGNLVFTYSGSDQISAALVGATNSPNATAPVTTVSEAIEFEEGIGTTKGVLQAVNASETPLISLSGPIGTFKSTALTIAPGPVDALQFRTETDGLGGPYDVPFQMAGTDVRSMHLAGYDSLGNFAENVNASYTGTGTLVGKLTVTSGTVTVIKPDGATGTGTVIGTPNNASLDPLESPQITVTSDAAVRFDIRTQNFGTEPAGQDFSIEIHALDAEGNDSFDYSGLRTLNFVNFSSPSWAGDSPVLPDGLIACSFVAGICNLPGPFKVTNVTAPALLSVSDETDDVLDVPDVWSRFIYASLGAGTKLFMATAPGGPPTAQPLASQVDAFSGMIEMTADDTLPIQAVLIDEGGNYVSDAPGTVSWSGAGTPVEVMAAANFSVTTGSSTVFDAAKAGTGTITISNGGYTPYTSDTVNVTHGVLHHADFVDTGAGTNTVDPGVCFQLNITLEDSDHNKVLSYNMTNTLTLTWENAASGPAVQRPPYFNVNGQGFNNTWTGSVGILNGEVNTQNINYCLYDGTSVTPQLRLQFPAKDGHPILNTIGHNDHVPSNTFAIAVGAEDHVHYSNDAGDTGNFVCPIWQFDNGGDTCATFNVDAGPRTVHSHVHDAGCNYIRTAIGNWTSTNPTINGELTDKSSPATQITFGNTIATYNNAGYLDFSPTDATAFNGRARFFVSPGAVTHVTAQPSSVTADVPFAVSVYLRDQFGNISGYGEDHDVTFDFGGTTSLSKAGNPATKAGDVTNQNFQFGYWNTPTAFQIPNASDSAVLTIGVSGLPTINHAITSNAGTPVQAIILDSPSASGALIPDQTVQSINTLNLYSCAEDVEGNFKTCGVDGAWTGTNELAGRLTPPAGSASTLYPMQVTATFGEVTITPNDGSIAAGTTGEITVVNGPLMSFQLDKVQSPYGQATAGVPFDIVLTATDSYGNAVTEFDGSYWISWGASNYSTTAENFGVVLPPDGNYTFLDGVCQDPIQVTLHNSSVATRIEMTYNDGSSNYYGYTFPFGGYTVVPGAPDHYGFTAPNNVAAKADHTTSFSATLQVRDAFGNVVCCGEASTNISLMNTNGSAANGTLQGTLVADMSSASSVSIPGFAYDIAGNRKLKALSASYATPTNASETITFNANKETVASYEIVPVVSATAGIAYPFTVRALDNEGGVVTGADAELNALTFAWTGPANAPDTTPPVMPAPIFSNGQATPLIAMYKAETISAASFTITDNQSSPGQSNTFDRTGQANADIDVTPGALNQYHISASTGATTADSSGLFNVTINAFDTWENPRAGDGCINLIPVRVSGATNTGTFGGTSTSCLNLGANTLTVNNIHYNVPHTISFSTTSSASTTQSDNVAFSATIDTVDNYLVQAPSNVIAGNNNTAVTVSARDAGNNVIVDAGVDTALNLQAYCWSGAGTSPAPASTPPVYGTTPAFSNGVSTFTHSLYRDQTIATGNLLIRDNYSGSCGPTRQGGSDGAIDIQHANADKYRVTAIGSQAVTAGVGFNVRVTAYDPYDNVDQAYGPATLTWNWTGTTPSPFGAVTSDVSPSGSKSFTNGIFNYSDNAFILYNESDGSPQLNLSSGFGGSLGGYSVTHNSTVGFVKIHDTNAADTAHTTAISNFTLTTDQTRQLWSHGYDNWGNYISLVNTTWSGSNVLTGKVTGGTGNTGTIDPDTIGTGTVTADHASATDDTTGTFTINPGAITKLVFKTAAVNQTTDQCATVTIETQDAENNPSPVGANTTVNLSNDLSGVFYSGSGCTGVITSTTITSGTSERTIYFRDTVVENPTLTADESPSQSWAAANQGATITVGAITKVVITSAALNQESGQCGPVTFEVQDAYNNQADVLSNTTFDLSSNSSSETFHTDSGCLSGAITQTVVNTGNPGATVYYKDGEVGLPTITIDENPSAPWTAATQAQTISPGAFNINALSSPNGDNTPDITWTASAGVSNYDVKLDNNSGCGSPEVTYSSVAGTSKTVEGGDALGDGTWYICVTALGNGSPNRVASNDNLSFIVDTTDPTMDAGSNFNVRVATQTDSTASDASSITYAWVKTAGTGTITFSPNNTVLQPTVSASADDSYTLQLTVTDAAGNSSVDTINFIWDTTNPTLDAGGNLTVKVATSTTSTASDVNTLTYAWTKTAGSGVVSYTPNATTLVPSVSASLDDIYTLQVTATDVAGNSSNDTMTFTWDTTNPSVDAGTNLNVRLATASDATASDLTSLTYAWAKTAGPGIVTFAPNNTVLQPTFSADTDGIYTLQVTATDEVALASNDTLQFIWDTTNPTIDAGTDMNVRVATATDSTASDANTLTYAWSKVSGPGTVTFSPANNVLQPTVSADTDGAYVLQLQTTDVAGNVSTDTINFIWDTTAPTMDAGSNMIVKVATATDSTASDTNTITYSWAKTAGSGTITFSPNNTTLQPTVSASADDTYTLELTVTDTAGNVSTDTITFQWDTTNPTVNAGSDFNVRVAASSDATASDATSLSYAWTKQSGPGTVTFSPNAATLQPDITASVDGDYVLQLQATDAVALSSTDTINFTWDTTNPTLNAGSDQTVKVASASDATASDANTLTYAWSKTAGSGTVTFAPNAATLAPTFSASADDIYTLQVQATDVAGNQSTDSISFTWDTTAPVIDAGSNLNVRVATAGDATASDLTSMTHSWSKAAGPGTVTFAPNNTILQPTFSADTDGVYTLRLDTTDEVALASNDTLQFIWDTTNPTVNAGTDLNVRTATATTATASDANTITYAWSKVSGPGTVTFAPNNTVVAPTVSADTDGAYVLQLSVTDTAGNNSTDTINFVWDTTAPTMDAGSNLTVKVGTATDSTASDTNTITYSWAKTAGTGTITFSPNNTVLQPTVSASADDTYTLELTVTDTAGNVSADTISFIWDTTNPTVNAGSDLEVRIATAGDATASDATSLTYAWSKTSGPGTVTFSPNAATLQPSFSADTDGAYVLQLQATDAVALASTDTINFVWDTTAPTANAGSDLNVRTATAPGATASDTNSITYAWSKISGSGTVTFTPNATTLNPTISADTDDAYVLRLTTTDTAGNVTTDDINFVWDTTNPTADAGSNLNVKTATATDSTASDTNTVTYAWAKTAGTGTITFSPNNNVLQPTVSSDTDGPFTLELTVTDQAGNQTTDTISFIWDTTAPTADAGSSFNVRTATASDATASDTNTITYAWTKTAGSGTVTFSPNANVLQPTISADTDDAYTLQLAVTDTAGNVTNDTIAFVWDTTNPTMDAGTNLTIKVGTATGATASDTNTITYAWSKTAGSGTVTFSPNNTVINPTVSADTDDTYTLQLVVTDTAGNSSNDTMTMVWDTTAPTMDAGTSLNVKAATASDATASDATSVTYAWSKTAGSGTVTFSPNATVLQPTFSADTDDNYTLQLQVTDAVGLQTTDTISFVWDTTNPTLDAGSNMIVKVATASDSTASDANTLTYAWSKTAGPGTVTFSPNAATLQPSISADADGSYTLQLQGTDVATNQTTDTISFVWDTTNPTVDAGSNLNVRVATGGDATASDATALTYAWTKTAGPGTVTFSPNASTLQPSFSADTDGTYTLQLEATDAVSLATNDTITFIWDTTNPTVNAGSDLEVKTATAPGATASDTNSVTYAWSKVSGTGTLSFSPSANVVNPTISSDTDGVFVARLTVTDTAGNVSTDDINFVWDTTAPTMDAGSNMNVRVATATDSTASDTNNITYAWVKTAGSGTVTFSPNAATLQPSVSASADDTYTLQLTATDDAGNSTVDTLSFVWDTTNPTVNAGSDLEVKTATAPGATASDTNSVTYAWSKVSGTGTLTFSPNANVVNPTISSDTDGAFVARLTVTDTAGNVNTDDINFIWDTTAPTMDAGSNMTVKVATATDSSASDTNSVTYSWSKTAGSGTVTFSPNNTVMQPSVSADTDDTYTLQLTVTDTAGNATSDTLTFVWDTTNPTVDAGTAMNVRVATASDATSSDATALTYSWTKQSGPGTVTFSPNATTLAPTFSADTDGSYVLQLQATDAVSNSSTDTVAFVWDTTNPTVNAGTDLEVKTATAPGATASDTNSVTYAWSKVSGTGTLSFSPSANVVNPTISSDTDGTFVARLTVTDTAGNVSTDDINFIWDTTVPTMDAGSNMNVKTATATDSTASDTNSVTYAWAKTAGSGTVTFSPNATVLQPSVSADTDDSYTLQLTVTDDAGNSSVDTLTFVWDTTLPTVNAGSDLEVKTATAPGATASDTNSVTYAWSKVSGTGTLSFSPNANVVNPTISSDTDGAFVARLTVTDSAGNVNTDDVNFVWDTTAPTMDAGSNMTVKVGTATDSTASDTNSITYAWSKTAGSGTVTFSPNATTLQPTVSADTDDTYTLQLIVTDTAGNSTTDTLTFVWDTTNPTVDAGTALNVKTATASDASASDATALTYNWTKQSGPGTVTFSPNATTLQPTFSADTDGAYVLHLEATDAVSNSSTDTVAFVWDTTLPTVNAGTDLNIKTATATTATASDTNTVTYAWSKVSGPGTVTFAPSNAVIQPNVSADTDGAYVLRLTVTDVAGNASTDDINMVWDTTAPTMDAGSNLNVKVATGTDSTASDTNTLTYAWVKTAGSGTVTFSPNAATLQPSVSASADDSYTLQLTATDAAGNSTVDTITFVWDTTAPTMDAGSNMEVRTATSTDSTASDTNSVTYAWSKVSGSGTPSFSPNANVIQPSVSADTDDTYVLQLNVTDAAGNSTTDTLTFIWDTTAPSAFSVSSPTNASTVYDNTPTVSWSDPTDADKYDLLVDNDSGCGSPTQSYTGQAWATSRTLTELSDGTYYVCVTALDDAGNSTDATETSFTVATGTWAATDESGAPAIRADATAIWNNTDSDMIVWGGYDGTSYLNTGGMYDPTGNSWVATDIADGQLPEGRHQHTAIWTASDTMIVWGGYNSSSTELDNGGVYDPDGGDKWVATDTADGDLPTARKDHTAVWTGTEMIIWGGHDGTSVVDTGGIYDPDGPDYWVATDTADGDTPAARQGHTAVWDSGNGYMIVWGGTDGTAMADGGRYDPDGGDKWLTISSTNAPAARYDHVAIWTGSKMIIWGGQNGSSSLNTGAIYDPTADTWTVISSTDVASARHDTVAVWDDASSTNQMIVFGGYNGSSHLATGAAFDPTGNSWRIPDLNDSSAPAARSRAATVWTGSKMIIWGGYDGTNYLKTGSRLTPP